MRHILCPTGTSIANLYEGPDGTRKAPRAETESDREDYLRWIRERVAYLRKVKDDRVAFLRAVSAETNSLLAMGLQPDDKLYLLHTETEAGACCARIVAEVVQSECGIEPLIKRIDGLQVRDAVRFRREGVPNLFNALRQLTENAPPESVVLNATGGFKGTVPFLTLYGLLHRLRTVYLFEFSEALIDLPPVPVFYDLNLLARAKTALLEVEEKTVVPRERFFERIPRLEYGERPLFETLVEDAGGGDVTLSPFAFSCLSLLRQRRSEIFLSAQARRALDSSEGPRRRGFEYILANLGDPAWRGQKVHQFRSSDLLACKPGNTNERAFYFEEGRGLYVCELLEHNEYDAFRGKRQDYARGKFAEYVPSPEGEVAIPRTDDELAREQQEELKQRDRQLNELHEELQKVRNALAWERQDKSRLEDEVKELRRLANQSSRQPGQHAQRKKKRRGGKGNPPKGAAGGGKLGDFMPSPD